MRAKALTVLAAMGLALCACAAVDSTPPPTAADAGNAALGLVYAEQTCAACHAVGPAEMRSPDPRARPFDAIANTPGLTHTALNAWLHSSHTNMPDLIVDSESVDDLYAYLSTLKRARFGLLSTRATALGTSRIALRICANQREPKDAEETFTVAFTPARSSVER